MSATCRRRLLPAHISAFVAISELAAKDVLAEVDCVGDQDLPQSAGPPLRRPFINTPSVAIEVYGRLPASARRRYVSGKLHQDCLNHLRQIEVQEEIEHLPFCQTTATKNADFADTVSVFMKTFYNAIDTSPNVPTIASGSWTEGLTRTHASQIPMPGSFCRCAYKRCSALNLVDTGSPERLPEVRCSGLYSMKNAGRAVKRSGFTPMFSHPDLL